MAGSILDLMTQPELLVRVKEEHEKRLEGQTYEPVTILAGCPPWRWPGRRLRS
jgi:hypothetical protein